MWKNNTIQIITWLLIIVMISSQQCHQCYNSLENQNCKVEYASDNLQAHTLHMSVHPHLDAFWIFDFQSYYSPNPGDGSVLSYFRSNRFNSVKQIFDETLKVLGESKRFRESGNFDSQKAHRSFFNSQMGFFKRWYSQKDQTTKAAIKQLLSTKYWEIVGGGYVEHDQGCAYYDDIIDNFQIGLHFLKEQFNYHPKAAISADSFGHSQSTLAILAQIGIEGFFVQRSDQHILKQNKTQFIWKAKSANGRYYGALPTHIRWAIHGFEDQFIPGGSNQQLICKTKERYIKNMQQENQFLKKILKSSHIMRYFGHDFQRFDDHSYYVMQGIMEQFSRQKCRKVSAVYGNPTQYFKVLMSEVFNKVKPLATREEDIMPIWDYDSGLYWTGYYTTDPFHKKNYRDVSRYLHLIRKAFLPSYIQDPNSLAHVSSYQKLQELAEISAYLQHHDGISGTSKYLIMDQYENLAVKKIEEIKQTIEKQLFEVQFPAGISKKIFQCSLQNQCSVPETVKGDVYLKIFNSGGKINQSPIIVHLKENQNYQPQCDYYEINCLCTGFPCPCSLYIFTKVSTYTVIKLRQVDTRPKDANLMRQIPKQSQKLFYNDTHFTIKHNQLNYSIGYKALNGDPTPRNYKHLTRYGTQGERSFTIRSGKYALGNDIKTQRNLSKIKKVYLLESDFLKKIVILWAREQMKTTITITNSKLNEWKVETYSAAEAGKLEDLYLEVSAPHIQNQKIFYTDSNGWLVMKRELFKHEDYQAFFSKQKYDDIDGNSYPMTAFCYIQDVNNPKAKISINTDRPQGVISYKEGTIWINYDRLSSDDGKWVFQTTLRNQYQKFTHYITVDNTDNNQRLIQRRYDEPLLIQGFEAEQSTKILQNNNNEQERTKWVLLSGLQHTKFLIKPWNDSSVILRVQNLHDGKDQTITLYTEDKISPFLTAYYGNTIHYDSIEETSLGGNIQYSEFLKNKWNWDKIVNLDQQNQMFNKVLSSKIMLRPLEIRTFVFRGLKIGEQCKKTEQISLSSQRIQYVIDTKKQMPTRSTEQKINENRINQYLLNGNHCNEESPVLKNGSSISTVKIDESKFNNNQPKQYSNDIVPEKQKVKENNQQVKNSNDGQKKFDLIDSDLPFQERMQAGRIREVEAIRKKIEKGIILNRSEKQVYFNNILKNFIEKTQSKNQKTDKNL